MAIFSVWVYKYNKHLKVKLKRFETKGEKKFSVYTVINDEGELEEVTSDEVGLELYDLDGRSSIAYNIKQFIHGIDYPNTFIKN